jgi:hypothetical protein
VIKAVWYCLIRNRIRFAALVLRVALKAVRRQPGPFLVALLGFVLQAGWCVLFVAAFYYVNVVQSPGSLTAVSFTSVSIILGFFWVMEVIRNIVSFTISGVVATWYYYGKPSKKTLNATVEHLPGELSAKQRAQIVASLPPGNPSPPVVFVVPKGSQIPNLIAIPRNGHSSPATAMPTSGASSSPPVPASAQLPFPSTPPASLGSPGKTEQTNGERLMEIWKQKYHLDEAKLEAAAKARIEGMPAFPTLRMLGYALTYSLGSIAFGSLIIAALKTFEYFYRQAKESNKPWIKALILFFIGCMETILQTFNLFAFVSAASRGTSYCGSAKITFGLIKDRLLDAIVSNDLVAGMLRGACFMGSLTLLGIACVVARAGFQLPWGLVSRFVPHVERNYASIPEI